MTIQYVKPDFPADAFAGTARYYAEYRVPYPMALTEDLLRRAGPRDRASLLDLACGPGRLTFPLAPSFHEVRAIDLDPEMIGVAREQAARRGMTHIRWMVGRAEDMEAEPASFDLITIGEAFHRLDQRLIGARALSWLRPGGHLAMVDSFGIEHGREPWQKAVAGIVSKWRTRVASGGDAPARPKPGKGHEHYRLVMEDAGFEGVEARSFVEPYRWTVESIVGNFRSTSICSRHALGDRADAFEDDLRAALLACDPSGEYRADIDCGYVLGGKPRT